MRIYIEDLRFQCIIGILDFERTTPQDVIINLQITYTFKENLFINYATVSQLIETRMQEEKFLLLEDALLYLSKILKQKFQAIETLELKITKPAIMKNSLVSVGEYFCFKS